MTPAALLSAVAFRLRAARAAPRLWWSAAAGVGLAGLALALVKAGLPLPAAAPEALAGAATFLALALAAQALLSGPGLAEAAYAVDARAGGAERFATLLDLAGAEKDPFRAAIARSCAAISKRALPSEVVPIRPSRALLSCAAAAALVAGAAALAPRAGDEARRLMAAEAGRLRAVAGSISPRDGGDLAEAREQLSALAAALASGRLDRDEVARALEQARASLERARRREKLAEGMTDLAREHPELLALAQSLGAGDEDRARAAAEAAQEHDAEARRSAAEALAGLGEGLDPRADPLRQLADAIAHGNVPRAEAAVKELARDIDDAGRRRAALSQAAATLEAALRRLPGAESEALASKPGGPSAGAVALSGAPSNPGAPEASKSTGPEAASADPTQQQRGAPAASLAATGRAEVRTALPPRLEAAVARYFHTTRSEETPR